MSMIRGSPRTPDRLLELSGSRVQQSEVFRTMTGACGPYNLGGFYHNVHSHGLVLVGLLLPECFFLIFFWATCEYLLRFESLKCINMNMSIPYHYRT